MLRTGLIAGVVLVVLTACQPLCQNLSFPPPEESPYVLPFPPGESYIVSQAECNPRGGHRNRIAIDFMMPMGAAITAARGGEVIEVVEKYRDGDLRRGQNNRILIRHEDGSIAWYAHLQQDSIVVEPGDRVEARQLLGRCGNTGNTGNLPHLHFEVFKETAYAYTDAIPVSFRDATHPLSDRGGLVARSAYQALARSEGRLLH
jgi:murein DD-endopeptidase MepM/ murein hydrolase activator NlpD